jgi:3-dehydroquinate synthase
MSASPHRIDIELEGRSYPILIGTGVLDDPASYASLPRGGMAMVVTNETVAPLFAQRLVRALHGVFRSVELVALPDGESFKDWTTLNLIFDAMLAAACDRNTTLFALGGGVVGDMTGFAAACYMRGIAYVQVPTTLLAQVDSSVGGKTAINHPRGKNMIGAFHQPQLVVSDTGVLATLPQREFVAGLAEVIKYGPIADDDFFVWCENHIEDLLAREPQALAHAIRRSCEIKAEVVGEDEREAGRRAILNFGHTFGHAIETGLGYGEWLHGEAVGCGMVMAAELSARAGLVSRAYSERVCALVARAGLPVRSPDLGVDRFFSLMRLDKKADAGAIRFVVLDAPGHASLRSIEDGLVERVIADRVR